MRLPVFRYTKLGPRNFATARRVVLGAGDTRLLVPGRSLRRRAGGEQRRWSGAGIRPRVAAFLRSAVSARRVHVRLDDVLYWDGTLEGTCESGLGEHLTSVWAEERAQAAGLLRSSRLRDSSAWRGDSQFHAALGTFHDAVDEATFEHSLRSLADRPALIKKRLLAPPLHVCWSSGRSV